jgi:hypothetical protein
MSYTREQIKAAVEAKGYKWFSDDANKTYDVNIVGVRNASTGKKVTNTFDDTLTISFKDEKGEWQFYAWAATTDPGKKSMLEWNKMGVKGGCARLVANQYRGVWKIDKHQGKYDALCQRNGNVKVYRDADFDLEYDEDKITEGMYGINIHKAGQDSTWVENWSAGCQVFKRVKDFDVFMSIVKKASKIHGNSFSYTLLNSTDIK